MPFIFGSSSRACRNRLKMIAWRWQCAISSVTGCAVHFRCALSQSEGRLCARLAFFETKLLTRQRRLAPVFGPLIWDFSNKDLGTGGRSVSDW